MFVCGPEKEAKKRMNKLNDLKQLVEAIEEKMAVPCTLVPPCCPPCCIPCCPNPDHLVSQPEPPKEPPSPPQTMVCYKTEKIEKTKREGRAAKKALVRTARAKSRELRASNLYVGCDCEKRNGLQDDCRRTGCHGSPECLTKPPICGPSEFCDAKHLYKKYGNGASKDGTGDANASADDDANGRVAVYYKCYPAAIKC